MSFSDRCDNDRRTHTVKSFVLQEGTTAYQKDSIHLIVNYFPLLVFLAFS